MRPIVFHSWVSCEGVRAHDGAMILFVVVVVVVVAFSLQNSFVVAVNKRRDCFKWWCEE